MIRKIGITNCRIFVSGENLWTGTKLSKLFDPETISGGNTDSNASALSRVPVMHTRFQELGLLDLAYHFNPINNEEYYEIEL